MYIQMPRKGTSMSLQNVTIGYSAFNFEHEFRDVFVQLFGGDAAMESILEFNFIRM